jgi:hypothetical protein
VAPSIEAVIGLTTRFMNRDKHPQEHQSMKTPIHTPQNSKRFPLAFYGLATAFMVAAIGITGCTSQNAFSPTLSKTVKDKRTNQQKIISAIFRDDVGVLKLYAARGMDVDITDFLGRSSMHHAARFGSDKVIVWLAKQGVNISTTDKYGATPLHAAAQYGKIHAAKALLAQGASANVSNKYGFTPLHWAARSRYVQVAQVLLDHGANPLASATIENLTPSDLVFATSLYEEDITPVDSAVASDIGGDKIISLLDSYAIK